MLLRTARFELEVHCGAWLRGSLYVRVGARDWWREW